MLEMNHTLFQSVTWRHSSLVSVFRKSHHFLFMFLLLMGKRSKRNMGKDIDESLLYLTDLDFLLCIAQ